MLLVLKKKKYKNLLILYWQKIVQSLILVDNMIYSLLLLKNLLVHTKTGSTLKMLHNPVICSILQLVP